MYTNLQVAGVYHRIFIVRIHQVAVVTSFQNLEEKIDACNLDVPNWLHRGRNGKIYIPVTYRLTGAPLAARSPTRLIEDTWDNMVLRGTTFILVGKAHEFWGWANCDGANHQP